jgi:hypothetical protein
MAILVFLKIYQNMNLLLLRVGFFYIKMKRAWQKLAHRRMINQRDIRQLTDYR